MASDYLNGLNDRQLQAARHSPSIPLQILAGPGSGKTKVLTSRIMYLIRECKYDPESICAVTFTNKAANEMVQRLTAQLGEELTKKIKVGTFHAISAKFLRKFGKSVGVQENFSVCDTDDSKKIMTKVLKQHQLRSKHKVTLKELEVLALISKAKANGMTAADALDEHSNAENTSSKYKKTRENFTTVLAEIYRDYQEALQLNNSLDFDDLLLFCVKLFSSHDRVKWCRHVLVDEFQDSNPIQYEWTYRLAVVHRGITIVGDPDQSIYGWRSAEVQNFDKMFRDFANTRRISLEQNYRSTGAILAASVAIVSQDKKRVQKSLHTTRASGPLPVLERFKDEHTEARFIADEVKRLVACTGGMLKWDDFAILLRFNSLSRIYESALQKQGIPNRVLAGHKFFERQEVKDLLAYLQVIDNPESVPAFSRVINVPPRGIGEKSVSELLAAAERRKLAPQELVECIYDAKMPDIKPSIKGKLKSFIEPIRYLRNLAVNGSKTSELLHVLIDRLRWQDHLRKTGGPEWESRWDNCQELITFAVDVETSNDGYRNISDDLEAQWIDSKDEFDNLDDVHGVVHRTSDDNGQQNTPTILRSFLQACMLSTDADTRTNDLNDGGKVTITTCHAAKGLEWPVVMIPAVESGTFPSSRAEDVEEERRLLYVACTRAQGLLYLSCCDSRRIAGESKQVSLSEFISAIASSNLLARQTRPLNISDLNVLAGVLGRKLPDKAIPQQLTEHDGQTDECGGSDSRDTRHYHDNPTFAPASRILLHASNTQYASSDSIQQIAKSVPLSPAPNATPRTPMNVLPAFSNTQPDNPRPDVTSSFSSTAMTSPATLNEDSPETGLGKRRLGMSFTAGGYQNKKFKSPTVTQ